MPIKRKEHYKRKLNGIYSKNNKPLGKSKWHFKSRRVVYESVEQDTVDAREVSEDLEAKQAEAEMESEKETAAQKTSETKKKQPANQNAKGKSDKEKKDENQPPKPSNRHMMQLLLAVLFSVLGVILLLGTLLLSIPMDKYIEDRKQDRLQARMELSGLITSVLPSMKVDDELNDMVMRALENQTNTYRNDSKKTVSEIEQLRKNDEVIKGLFADSKYATADFEDIVEDAEQTGECLQFIQVPVSDVDEQITAMGVATLKEQIAEYKGTVKTETREDENGETVTETVVEGGLIPQLQAEKDALQKKHDEIKGKYDALQLYFEEIDHKIIAMHSRLDGQGPGGDRYSKMKAITEYVKSVHPDDNIFLADIVAKLASFPGETREEDDILFMMKIEEETGIRMPTVNYGQDYQLTKLSNGMLLCYEVYTIPYQATYQGMKNLIEYFNQNDDFYASVYTLTMQYNPATETIFGNVIILHYYLLSEDAEYIPPVIDEDITIGDLDSIFGDMTDNNKGKQSPYTVADVKSWLESGKTFEDVVAKLKGEGYRATELAWIMKDEYSTPSEMQKFLEDYGEEGVEYDIDYVMDLLECDIDDLMEIYYAPSSGGSNKDETTEDESTEEDTTEGESTEDNTTGNQNPEQPESGKQSDYTVTQIETMMSEQDMSLRDVRDMLKQEDYPAIELAWILHEEYQTEDDIIAFLLLHQETEYSSLDDAAEFFECSKEELKAIYSN